MPVPPDQAPLLCTCGQDVCAGFRPRVSPCGPGRPCCCESRCTCGVEPRSPQVRVPYPADASGNTEAASRQCSYCVPERAVLNEMEHLAAQYRTRMQRSQRRDMVDTLLQQDGPTPNRSRAAVQYVDTTASLLRSSRGNAIQHSAQREQQLRRQKLQRELSSRRQKFSRQGYGGGGEDYCCCAPHDNERQNGYRGPSKTVRGGSAGSMKFFCCHREADGNHTRCDPCDVEIHCIYPTSKGEYSTAVPRAAPSARTSGVSPGPPPSHDHRPVAHSRKGIDKDCPACGCQLQATQLDGHEMLIDVQACPQCGLVMGRRQAQAPAADGCRSTAAPTAATGAKKGLVLKHGHKVFVSDAEYLQRRSDYMKLWEDNGLVVPVQQRGVRETAPLPQQTPRWRTVAQR